MAGELITIDDFVTLTETDTLIDGVYIGEETTKFKRGRIQSVRLTDIRYNLSDSYLIDYSFTFTDYTITTIVRAKRAGFRVWLYFEIDYIDETETIVNTYQVITSEKVGDNLWKGTLSLDFYEIIDRKFISIDPEPLDYGASTTINDDGSERLNVFVWSDKENTEYSVQLEIVYHPEPSEPPEPPEPPEPIEPDVVDAKNGVISGIGSIVTRKNEMTADMIADVREKIVGYYDTANDVRGVVIKDDNHDFNCFIQNRGQVALSDGIAVAFGYFGYCGAATFDFLPPAVKQYHFIYAEWNKSVVPNEFSIKVMNNQSSPNPNNAFRQDELSRVKTGIFQLPLWRVDVTNQGVQSVTSLRDLRSHIERVSRSYSSKNVSGGGIIEDNVISEQLSVTDNSKKVANCQYVHAAVRAEIIKEG